MPMPGTAQERHHLLSTGPRGSGKAALNAMANAGCDPPALLPASQPCCSRKVHNRGKRAKHGGRTPG